MGCGLVGCEEADMTEHECMPANHTLLISIFFPWFGLGTFFFKVVGKLLSILGTS